jgi:hypothetical protein
MKDIIEKIDEMFAPFMMGVQAARGKSGGKPKKNIIDDLYSEVVWNKFWKTDQEAAIEDVIKTKKVDKRTAKKLRKYIKKSMGK